MGAARAMALVAGCLLAGAAGAAPVSEPVKVTGGQIVGTYADGINRYLGVPFAAPPVGKLRWRPPQADAQAKSSIDQLTNDWWGWRTVYWAGRQARYGRAKPYVYYFAHRPTAPVTPCGYGCGAACSCSRRMRRTSCRGMAPRSSTCSTISARTPGRGPRTTASWRTGWPTPGRLARARAVRTATGCRPGPRSMGPGDDPAHRRRRRPGRARQAAGFLAVRAAAGFTKTPLNCGGFAKAC